MTGISLDDRSRADIAARYPEAVHGSARRRALTWGLIGLMLLVLVYAFWTLEFSLFKILRGTDQLGLIVGLMIPPNPETVSKALVYLRALWETICIAFLGTLLAAIIAFPLSFFAARNVVPQRIIQFMARRGSDTIRGVDALIWALIWVNVVGLGPFAGMLAIMTSDIGGFAKLFSEAIEAADKRDEDGIRSTGGGHLEAIRFGIIPQVLPVMASQVLYFFESNTRSSTIIGIVGAGGIGLHLAEQIRTLEWQHVSFIILLVLVAVTIIDTISSRLRFAIIGEKSA